MLELLQLPHAARQLRRLRKNNYRQFILIAKAIADLAHNPRPVGASRLVNRSEWRIRVGDFRVLYEVNDSQQTVIIVAIGHRRDIYK